MERKCHLRKVLLGMEFTSADTGAALDAWEYYGGTFHK
jgi:hypothetical protein